MKYTTAVFTLFVAFGSTFAIAAPIESRDNAPAPTSNLVPPNATQQSPQGASPTSAPTITDPSNWVDDSKAPIEKELRDGGFTDDDFIKWTPFVHQYYKAVAEFCTDCYAPNVEELLGWKKSGLSPVQASELTDAGLGDPDQAAKVLPYFTKVCGKKIYDLDKINPYSVARKCFHIQGYAVFQLLGTRDALTSNDNASPAAMGMSGPFGEMAQRAFKEHIVLVHFKGDAPNEDSTIDILAIGTGAYKYTAATGALTTASKMRVLIDLSADAADTNN